jgi:hypothetical protein
MKAYEGLILRRNSVCEGMGIGKRRVYEVAPVKVKTHIANVLVISSA